MSKGWYSTTHVNVGGEIGPDPFDTVDHGLSPKDALGSDLEGDSRDLAGEDGQLFDHGVDRVFEHGHFSFGFDLDSL